MMTLNQLLLKIQELAMEVLGPGGVVTAHHNVGGPRPGKLKVQSG